MKKFIAVLLSVILAAAALSGCAKSADTDSRNTSSKDTASSKPQKITVVLDWTPNTNHTGLYVAQAKGYFKAQGLDVEIQQPPQDGALSLLASGKAQFAVSFQDEIATALTASTPLDVVAVAALIQHNDSGIISLKSKGVTSPKKMEGMRYATWNSPIEQAVLKDVIAKDGGDFKKVKMVPEDVDDIVQALKTNIDCVWVYYPQEGIEAKVAGLQTNYFAFKDLDPALDFYTPVLASSQSYLKKNPETAKKFLKAVEQGYRYAISDPQDAANILCKAVPGTNSQDALLGQEWLKTQYMAEVKQWGYIDTARWDQFFTWLYNNKVFSKKLPSGDGFTDAYLPQE